MPLLLKYSLFLLLLLPCAAWSQVSFKAIADQKEVAVGQRFEVAFQLRDAKSRTFTPPIFNGFQAVATTEGYATSFSNGKAHVIYTITYVLVPSRVGKFKVGAAKILTTEGKELQTKAFEVKVVSAADKPKTSEEEAIEGKVFVKTEVNDSTPIVGQQVIVDIKIYTQLNIEQLEVVKEPTFKDFFSHQVRSYDGPKLQETINGKTYTAKVLRRLVVFPTKSGQLLIEPAAVRVALPVNGSQSSQFNPFFQLATHTLSSNPINLQVRALDGAPAGFSGLVGKFELQAHVNRNKINGDDVFQLQLRIEGEGDIKQVAAPNLGVNQKYFDQFAPESNEQLREVRGVLGGTKMFDYVLTPKAVGDFTIQPEFIYFDPQLKKFVKLDTTIQLSVQQGKNQLPTLQEIDKKQEKVAVPVLNEPRLTPRAALANSRFEGVPTSLWGNALFWLLMVLPLVGLGMVYYLKNKKDKKAATPLAVIRQQQAASQAAKRLATAKALLRQKEAKPFYNEISKALLGFVGDQYHIATIDLTKDKVKKQLLKQEIATDKIDTLMAILQKSEMALFAGMTDTLAMQQVYDDSVALIKLMEK